MRIDVEGDGALELVHGGGKIGKQSTPPDPCAVRRNSPETANCAINEFAAIGSPHDIGNNGTKAAAFQLAIWKIESDWGDNYALDFSSNPTNGPLNNFQASGNSAATDQAVTWLTDLENHTYDRAGLVALTNDRYQDQVAAVPVPPSILLAGSGILCLFGCGWVRRRERGLVVARRAS